MIEEIASQMSFVDVFNFCVLIICTALYGYQLIYAFIVLTRPCKKLTAKRNHRYAVLIPARNERAVIGNLIRSIQMQSYPIELIDIFVIADNCTDDTAEVARNAGAIVIPRSNTEQVGKGYALNYGFQVLRSTYADRGYEAYFVFDADNVLDENYFREMNATFDNGAKASTCYRNSKNFGSNWISAGYGLMFLREAKFLSQARLTLDTSCAISGTGWYVSAEIIEKHNGWNWFLLTEDIEFSISSVVDGEKISYCPTAIIYDEQPITFRDQWNQRFRWAKGFYQVFGCYAKNLFMKLLFNKGQKNRLACYDMLMTVSPAMLLTVFILAFDLTIVVLGAMGILSTGVVVASAASSLFFCVFNNFLFNFIFGVLTTYTEWNSIHLTKAQKIKYMFTFPIFQIVNVPIVVVALFGKAVWKPIPHNYAVDVSEFAQVARIAGTADEQATR